MGKHIDPGEQLPAQEGQQQTEKKGGYIRRQRSGIAKFKPIVHIKVGGFNCLILISVLSSGQYYPHIWQPMSVADGKTE